MNLSPISSSHETTIQFPALPITLTNKTEPKDVVFSEKIIPELSSYYFPQKTMPLLCSHPLIEKYINGLETGMTTFENIESDESVLDKVPKTMDVHGNVIESNGNPYDSPIGYVWKQLCDTPIVIGITKGIHSDHDPHYHPEPECYYVISGKAKTLCNDQYIELQKGDYFYIPGNTIHNTPILPCDSDSMDGEAPFSVLYWFPVNHTFSSFQYRWKRNTTDPEILLRFQKVDEIRKRDLLLEPYETKPTTTPAGGQLLSRG